ncbi:MAG: hypothetical protein A4E65_03479 [Syntrophorhabdus sp. PtaU1.Bin153]|nr:MAG: hypothetical protein A4E65_03479 [Syntrophorhabdus sp. PtaU1.Bin153]
MSEPNHLTVTYDDGSTRTVDFSKVASEVRLALAKMNLCSLQPDVHTCRHYVLLEWDGWQEVVGLDCEFVELLRYFVIRRIEDRGRLSFNIGSDEPELFIIKRLPKELKGIIVAGDGDMKAYDFSPEVERWEGIFETGGKIEYVKHDKAIKAGREQNSTDAMARAADLFEALARELQKRNLNSRDLVAMNHTQKLGAYREIAKGMGLRGMQRQEDVYGFIEFLLKRLGKTE